jgi:flagellin
MTMSVNTNVAAMVALQNLSASTRELETTQGRISTGMKVARSMDNASVYAIAQNMRGDIGALDAVTTSLNRAKSITDVAMTAGEAISNLLVSLKEKVLAANDPSIDTVSRNALQSDFASIRRQITSIVTNATFDGANIVNGSLTSIGFIADADATNRISVIGENLSISGAIVTITAATNLSSLAAASTALALVNASLTNVNAALGRLGSIARQVDNHITFVGKLQDSFRSGVGNLVDANLATESARLQALQIKQQLGSQSLSIANSAPQVILSLFRQ